MKKEIAKKKLIDFNNKHFDKIKATEFNTLVEIASRIQNKKGKINFDMTGLNPVCLTIKK